MGQFGIKIDTDFIEKYDHFLEIKKLLEPLLKIVNKKLNGIYEGNVSEDMSLKDYFFSLAKEYVENHDGCNIAPQSIQDNCRKGIKNQNAGSSLCSMLNFRLLKKDNTEFFKDESNFINFYLNEINLSSFSRLFSPYYSLKEDTFTFNMNQYYEKVFKPLFDFELLRYQNGAWIFATEVEYIDFYNKKKNAVDKKNKEFLEKEEKEEFVDKRFSQTAKRSGLFSFLEKAKYSIVGSMISLLSFKFIFSDKLKKYRNKVILGIIGSGAIIDLFQFENKKVAIN